MCSKIGPATIPGRNGPLLAGVASYLTHSKATKGACGPVINNGLGTYKDESSNYVDVNAYINWIRATMNSGIAKQIIHHAGVKILTY